MNFSQDPDLNKSILRSKAEGFMESIGSPMFFDREGAILTIGALDSMIDTLTAQLPKERLNSDYRIVESFGSLLGEALKLAIGGDWYYSENWGRWVVLYNTPDGSRAEMNVFRKMENRFKNGTEDSISFYFQGLLSAFFDKSI